ncbi:YfgM family protein [Flocculibacter collagenilyticus]|uniref:YfgM family protein n=1 Tax=Flocculibacter collagenilyticus TaxID=2744479 RepID=UPI0018F445A5|nr:tetratricopeptide repeat protein [Flocculibacter collagenilyticus]
MEIYNSEEQQVEAIKRFWKENGNAIILGAAIGLAGIFGWRQYSAMQIEKAETASDGFAQVIEKSAGDADALADANAYIEKHKGTQYAVFAAFISAKEAVEANKLEDAITQLNFAAENAGNDSLKSIALTRLARVQAELGNFDAALSTIAKVNTTAFKARAAEIKGDILIKQGNVADARTAYQAAADAGGLEGNVVLQQKIDNLAAPVQG